MRQIIARILARTGRIRLSMATRQSFSHKAGRIDSKNHLPPSPSSTEEDTSDGNTVLVEEEEEVVDVRSFMHGRRNIERRDSVNDVILTERMTYQQRLASWSSSSPTAASSSSSASLSSSPSSMTQLIKEIEAMGLGTKRRRHRVYHTKPRQSNASAHVDQTKTAHGLRR